MSSQASTSFPFALGQQPTNTAYTPLLGRLFTKGGNLYRLVQNGATPITSPKFSAVASAVAGGVDTWVVALSAVAGGDPEVVGIIPVDYGTTTIAASAFFYVQVTGNTFALPSSTTTITQGIPLSTLSTALGQVQPVVTTIDGPTAFKTIFATVVATAVATALGSLGGTIAIRLNRIL